MLLSHPAWVCGLKLGDTNYRNIGIGSHPAWVCGLKHRLIRPSTRRSQVTPCVGVWIETLRINILVHVLPVTPCVGVWIETGNKDFTTSICFVTPCVGVWIETSPFGTMKFSGVSHPAWVCGLKQ